MATVEIPDELLGAVVDAINCYTDCAKGERATVEEIWLLQDDKKETGGTFIHIAERLQNEVGDLLRTEEDNAHKRDPTLQEFLHRAKMMRKHGFTP